MTTIDNAAIAKQLGLSKEEMIARFGEPGTKTPEEIGSALGMDHDAIIKAFGEKNSTDSGDSFVNTSSTSDSTLMTSDSEFVLGEGGLAAFFEANGTEDKDDDEVNAYKENDVNDDVTEDDENNKGKSGKADNSKKSDSSKKSDKSEKTDSKEDKAIKAKAKKIAAELGYSKKSVSKVLKAIANNEGSGVAPEKLVSSLAKKLNLSEKLVAAVLGYLNNGQI